LQIDFHHAATYAACRLAGMTVQDAGVVAHAAQYVDDATHDGAIELTDGGRYIRATSAHKMLDYKNLDAADNRLIWAPFHFLPGNLDDSPAGGSATSTERFERRMMCRPNSSVAQQMARHCVEHQELPFALQRFGVAMHTYVDTWAHQQFVGMVSKLNKVQKLSPHRDPAYESNNEFRHLNSGVAMFQREFANIAAVGHGGVMTYPDLPFLKWEFTRENGERVTRDNPTDFLAAFKALYETAYRFQVRDADAAAPALLPVDVQAVDRLLRSTIAIDGDSRHRSWIAAIGKGAFSFGPERVRYIARGPGSWKQEALGEDPEFEERGKKYQPRPGFLTSNWKRFHDALHYHRSYVLHELLPAHDLCAS
jgi:hypothetical protein